MGVDFGFLGGLDVDGGWDVGYDTRSLSTQSKTPPFYLPQAFLVEKLFRSSPPPPPSPHPPLLFSTSFSSLFLPSSLFPIQTPPAIKTPSLPNLFPFSLLTSMIQDSMPQSWFRAWKYDGSAGVGGSEEGGMGGGVGVVGVVGEEKGGGEEERRIRTNRFSSTIQFPFPPLNPPLPPSTPSHPPKHTQHPAPHPSPLLENNSIATLLLF